ncbi:Transposon Ty3-G Gag-Pol polyprotein [Araneus ventricosus]|uniref:Transposon Ty3-G Gag-Pol polyprotein n=1 Tax=Araneus ventricosus TaxID=182803 RepID=A0A4Y2E3D6_ARAVE|nr:Transposon Ty3-G Gag-Pol polyprotein [Araneus ventricosus]
MILVEAPVQDPRPCIDYRKLNNITKTKFFPLPNVEERIETAPSAKYMTIDLSKGYWRMPLTPNAQRLTAFVTSFGTYKPLRMPFGLQNSPYEFSKMISQLLEECEGFSVPYLADIAIFSNFFPEHLRHMSTVLRRIQNSECSINY